jgi:hypothetical protein
VIVGDGADYEGGVDGQTVGAAGISKVRINEDRAIEASDNENQTGGRFGAAPSI